MQSFHTRCQNYITQGTVARQHKFKLHALYFWAVLNAYRQCSYSFRHRRNTDSVLRSTDMVLSSKTDHHHKFQKGGQSGLRKRKTTATAVAFRMCSSADLHNFIASLTWCSKESKENSHIFGQRLAACPSNYLKCATLEYLFCFRRGRRMRTYV